MLDVLRVRDYRLVATGQLLSTLGDWLLLVAAPYFVLRLTGSTLATGLSLGAETAPALLLAPVAGVFADRWDRRRTMLAADLLRAGCVALMLLVHHPGQVWLIYPALLAEAGFGQFFNPALQSLIPALVGRGARLSAANSLAALIGGTVRLVGGPAGGALYALAGFRTVVGVDVASYLASAALLAAMRRRRERGDLGESGALGDLTGHGGPGGLDDLGGSEDPETSILPGDGTPWRRFADEARDGLAHIRATPGLPAMFTAAGVFLAGNGAATALLVPYTGTVLHAATGVLGLLFGALGVGYLAGAPISRFVAAHLSDRAVMAAGLLCLGAVFAAAFDVRDTAWCLVLFTLIGPPAVCFLATANAYLARRTPDRLLGRAGAAYGMVQAGSGLAGLLAGAFLGQQIGIVLTLNLAALTVAVAAVAALCIPRPRLSGEEDELAGSDNAASARPSTAVTEL